MNTELKECIEQLKTSLLNDCTILRKILVLSYKEDKHELIDETNKLIDAFEESIKDLEEINKNDRK